MPDFFILNGGGNGRGGLTINVDREKIFEDVARADITPDNIQLYDGSGDLIASTRNKATAEASPQGMSPAMKQKLLDEIHSYLRLEGD